MKTEALPLTGDAEADKGHAKDEADGYSRIVTEGLLKKGYTLEQLLGLGSRSRVYLAKDRTGDTVALRVQSRFSQFRPREKPTLWNRTLLRLLPVVIPRHPNLVHYRNTGSIRCSTWTSGETCILMFAAMSQIEGPSLERLLKDRALQAQGPVLMMKILIGILEGWSALHRRGLRQGDIHPGNILLEAPTLNPVLIDLRISIRYGRPLKHERRRFRALLRALLTGTWRNEHDFPPLSPADVYANWNGQSPLIENLLKLETELGTSLQRAAPPVLLAQIQRIHAAGHGA